MDQAFSQSCCFEEAVFCLYTPLNVCLASGDLHKRDFHHYINQWGHFLIAFPQTYVCCFWYFSSECDLNPTAETTQHSVTAKYVKFLLATPSGNLDMLHLEIPTPAERLKIAAHVLSAITPCVRLSATLAKLIKPVIRSNKVPRQFNIVFTFNHFHYIRCDVVCRSKALNASVHVISCWCGDLMRSALSGWYRRMALSPYFNGAIQKYEREHGKPHVTVYIGYSVEDLLCLLKADIGIVFRSDQCIIDVGGWFGVKFICLFEGTVAKQREFFESAYSSDCEWNMVSTGEHLHGSLVIPSPRNVIPPIQDIQEVELSDSRGKDLVAVLSDIISQLPFYRCKVCKCYIAAAEHMRLLGGNALLFSVYPRNLYFKCSDPA
ncbi:hypothetical protein MKX01_012428 [Papaver californicum]|nr:hypothetical protein MKX01_012428 [Papaver californicum]